MYLPEDLIIHILLYNDICPIQTTIPDQFILNKILFSKMKILRNPCNVEWNGWIRVCKTHNTLLYMRIKKRIN